MNELATVLEELVADAPLERSSWSDVEERSRRLAAGRRRSSRRFAKQRLLLVVAALVFLALAGGAVGVGVSLLAQQESYHAGEADHPGQIGPLVEITSGESWAMVAWRSDVGVCIDFVVVPGRSPFGCDFPVRGAKPANDTSGSGPPVHAAAGFVSGAGLVGGDGKATIFGIAATEVAAVKVELRDNRLVETQVFDAPAELGADVRFFIVRLSLPQRLSDPGRVRAFLAYDKRGDLIERFES